MRHQQTLDLHSSATHFASTPGTNQQQTQLEAVCSGERYYPTYQHNRMGKEPAPCSSEQTNKQQACELDKDSHPTGKMQRNVSL